MKRLRDLVLYASLAIGANAALADTAALEALREGSMKKLVFLSEPLPVSDEPFIGEDGADLTLAAFEGKHILLNFWATWCAPCRKEMPALSQLQAEFGDESFEVVTIATGRNPMPAINRFFEEIEVSNLPLHRDPKQGFSRDMAVLGLPITLIIDPEGREIARLRGDADWHSDSARAIVAALKTGS